MPRHRRKPKCSNKYEKCGEIFHFNGSFEIICTDCDDKHYAFQDFLQHFQRMHFIEKEDILKQKKKSIENEIETPKDATLVEEESGFNISSEVDSQIPLDNCVSLVPFPTIPAHKHADFETITILPTELPESLEKRDTTTNSKYPSNEEKGNAYVSVKDEIENDDSSQFTNTGADKHELPLNLRKTQSCELCAKKFVSERSLMRHVDVRHLDFKREKKTYNCSQCSEIFNVKNDLFKHERITHVRLKCTLCPKSYLSRRRLKEHILTHDENVCFPCDYGNCTKTFKTLSLLSTHKNSHNPTKFHLCDICGFQTIRRQTLLVHVRSHTGEKNFSCNICGKYFISSSMVKEHQASHSTDRQFKCDVCGASFTRKKSLYHHKPLHLAIKKFVCTICEKPYAQAAGLSAHMRKHKIDGKIQPGLT